MIQDWPRRVANEIWSGERIAESREFLFVHVDKVTGFREAALPHVGDILAEGGDAFFLETSVFGEEIPVGLRVAGETFVVFTEEIVGKEELGVASGPGTQ